MRGTNGPFRYGSLCRRVATMDSETLCGARVAVTLGNKRLVFAIAAVYEVPDSQSFAIGWGTVGEAPERWIDGRSHVSKWITDVSVDQVVNHLHWMCLGGRWLKGRVSECLITETRPMQGYIWISGEGHCTPVQGRGEAG